MAVLPPVARNFEAERFLGTWHIIATNYGFWKRRTHPSVSYAKLPGEPFRMSDRLAFEARSLFRGAFRPNVLEGIDKQDGEPGRFIWRGKGLLGLIRSPWCVVAVGEEYDWAVTYFARSNIGTAPGVDIYARARLLAPEQVSEILRQVRADPFMASACEGMFATVQPDVDGTRYRFGDAAAHTSRRQAAAPTREL